MPVACVSGRAETTGRCLSDEEGGHEGQDRYDFGHANEHGLPFNKPHWQTLADARGFPREITRAA